MGMMIPLAEYAKRLGIKRDTVYHKYQRGVLQTAVKMCGTVMIDEDEPYVDSRVKTGRYVDFRKSLSTYKGPKSDQAEPE